MSEIPRFSLITQPWITVLDDDGIARDVSVQGLFAEAARLRLISGDLPTQDAAVLRLLLAILHRALESRAPADVEDVVDVVDELARDWDAEALPLILSYLRAHEGRFDLLHPVAPFFQTAGMVTTRGDVSELAKIIADMPAGRPYLTMRSAAAAARISHAEAARWLVHAQAYDPSGIKTGVVGHPRARGGRVYPEGTAWTGQLGLVHLVGSTVKDTLLLNLWATLLNDEQRARDLPPWERDLQDLEPSPDLRDRPAGPVDLYTWQPRRVLLHGDGDGITGVLITYGDRFLVQDRQAVVRLEPMSLWRYSKPQTAKYRRPIQMTQKHRPGVALWRGIAAVLPNQPASAGEQAPAPCVLVEHAARMRSSSILADGIVRYRAVGCEYGAQESVIDEVVEDTLDLPAGVLDPEQVELRHVALEAVTAAKAGVAALAGLARGLARASGAGKDESTGPGDRAYEDGFAALDAPYRTWLRTRLAASADQPLAAEREWHEAARAAIAGLGAQMIEAVPDKAWVGYGSGGRRDDVGVVHRRFLRDLAQAFPRAGLKQAVAASASPLVDASGSDSEEQDR